MGERLDLGILGPLSAGVDGQRLKITSARQRTILALLVLRPDQVVTADTLVDSIWPRSQPATARTQVSICVAALRKLFASLGVADGVIVTEHPGYRLNSAGHEIDWVLFEQDVAQAEAAVAGGDLAEAERCYARALGRWRGPALSEITGELAESEARRLGERRLKIRDDAFELALELGRHKQVLGELAAAVRDNPLREHTVGMSMLAQYRSGRRVESLETFRQTRRLLVTDLGVEPGPDLLKLHAAILRDDPALAPPHPDGLEAAVAAAAATLAPPSHAALVVPSELPPDTHGFVGRGAELAALDLLAVPAASGYGPTVGLVTGVAGIGKSSLAVHWAHQVADRFPDGRLFADLRGYDDQHDLAPATEILSQFLRSLGVPGEQIPNGAAERTALYRSLLTDRKVLVVLDNARTFEQVRPLLPSSPGCAALITGRAQLESLIVAPPQARVHLGVLPQAEALRLLSGIIGPARVAEAPQDAAELVEFCDHLPLAVRVAGARLASKPHWTLRRLAHRLADESQRLDELSEGDSRVRAGFELSYRHLEPTQARLYQALSLLDVPDFPAWVGAALLDVPLVRAERMIEQLVDTQLLEVSTVDCTGSIRYRFQNLLRLYARERSAESDAAERTRALDRVLSTYLGLAVQAHRREYGGSFTVLEHTAQVRELDADLVEELLEQPLEWFVVERRSLTALVKQAAAAGEAQFAWNLTMSMVSLFEVRNYVDDWQTCCEHALAAAQAAGDVRGEACMLHDLGAVALRKHDLRPAADYFGRALERYSAIDEAHGTALTLRSLAIVDRLDGQLDRAAERLALALPVFRKLGDLSSEAHALNNQAQIELDRGSPARALEFAAAAVSASERIGVRGERSLAQSIHRMARAQLALGRWEEAQQAFRRVIAIVEELSDLVGRAHACFGLGEAQLSAGRVEEALQSMTDALALTRPLHRPLLEGQIALAIAQIKRRQGHLAQAREWAEQAQAQFDLSGSTLWRRNAGDELALLTESAGDGRPESV